MSDLTRVADEIVRGMLDTWYAPIGILMRQPGKPVRASEVRALATEVLAQRDRRCETCRHFADEDGNDVCQHLRLANLPHTFGCTDWAAKEGAPK